MRGVFERLGRIRIRIQASSFRAWTINANDGIIATAGLLQGFAGAGASDRLLLYTALAATIAGGLSIGGAEWAEAAAEREAQLRLAAEEARELEENPQGEVEALVAYWRSRGLDEETARAVARQLAAKDAVLAQLEAEHNIDEVLGPVEPIWAGVAATFAFMVGASIPLLITWFAPVAIETWAILAAVVFSLILTSIIAARGGRLSLSKVLVRTLTVGLGTMIVSYLTGQAFF